MLTVTNCLERQRKDGSVFTVLEITGSVELVESLTTKKFYATVRKCFLPFTGTLETAKLMIGQKIEGEIVRVICEPYSFTNPRTGEIVQLQHSWAYQPKESNQAPIGHTRLSAFHFA